MKIRNELFIGLIIGIFVGALIFLLLSRLPTSFPKQGYYLFVANSSNVSQTNQDYSKYTGSSSNVSPTTASQFDIIVFMIPGNIKSDNPLDRTKIFGECKKSFKEKYQNVTQFECLIQCIGWYNISYTTLDATVAGLCKCFYS